MRRESAAIETAPYRAVRSHLSIVHREAPNGDTLVEKISQRPQHSPIHGDGETTLQWLRSRQTEQCVDAGWEAMPGISDLDRNQRQRRFLIDMLHNQVRRSGPTEILGAMRAVAPHLTIDDGLSLPDAAAWVWRFRGSDVESVEIPVRNETTSSGAAVLVPSGDLAKFAASILD